MSPWILQVMRSQIHMFGGQRLSELAAEPVWSRLEVTHQPAEVAELSPSARDHFLFSQLTRSSNEDYKIRCASNSGYTDLCGFSCPLVETLSSPSVGLRNVGFYLALFAVGNLYSHETVQQIGKKKKDPEVFYPQTYPSTYCQKRG